MENILILAIVVLVIGLAAGYVIKARKTGRKCIGCPGSCSKNGCASCSCCNHES